LPLTLTGGSGWGRPDIIGDPVLPKAYRQLGDGVTSTMLPDGSTVVIPKGRILYFNPNAFANGVVAIKNANVTTSNPGLTSMVVDTYHWGNAPRILPWLRNWGVNNHDVTLMGTFRILEHLKADFRADARNAFNHTQFTGGIDTGLGGTVIGTTFNSGGVTPDWTKLPAASQARLGHASNGNFGTFNPAGASVRSARYLQFSMTLKF
jgi:hypothetical protein